MAPPEPSSVSLPEPLQAPDHQDKKDRFSDLMPVELGGLELSEPVKCSRHQGQEFRTVTAGDMDYTGQCQYPHGQSTANICLDRHSPTLLQRRDSSEKRLFGIDKALFWLGILCLVLFIGVIAASAVAGSKAKSLSLMEQSYRELRASASPPTLPPSSNETMTSIPLPQPATDVNGEALTNCTPSKYTVPGSNISFIRECSTDYPGQDMGQVPLTRMEDCMNLCAALQIAVQSFRGHCIGVAWKTGKKNSRQGEDNNFCFLKYKKGRKGDGSGSETIESAWIDGGKKNEIS